ncbi:MAG TPA: zf-HC2 domain-containing protein [Gemmatimonadaceae bacterium]|nr:zf-HC2 domain-containing protein [Gemmatimonadaceae bacterium]
MTDCPNVEMRELLPELLHDALAANERERVDAHLASCAACAAELSVLRAAQRALGRGRVPAIDTAGIVAALPRPRGEAVTEASAGRTAAGRGSVQRHSSDAAGRTIVRPVAPRRPSTLLFRIAAAVTFVSVGGMSLSIARSYFGASPAVIADSAMSAESAVGGASADATADTPVAASAPAGSVGRGLGVHAVLGDVDDASLESLISELDQLEAAPLAEPEGTPGSRLIASAKSGSLE